MIGSTRAALKYQGRRDSSNRGTALKGLCSKCLDFRKLEEILTASEGREEALRAVARQASPRTFRKAPKALCGKI